MATVLDKLNVVNGVAADVAARVPVDRVVTRSAQRATAESDGKIAEAVLNGYFESRTAARGPGACALLKLSTGVRLYLDRFVDGKHTTTTVVPSSNQDASAAILRLSLDAHVIYYSYSNYKRNDWGIFPFHRSDVYAPQALLSDVRGRIVAHANSDAQTSADAAAMTVKRLRDVPEIIEKLLAEWRGPHSLWFNERDVDPGNRILLDAVVADAGRVSSIDKSSVGNGAVLDGYVQSRVAGRLGPGGHALTKLNIDVQLYIRRFAGGDRVAFCSSPAEEKARAASLQALEADANRITDSFSLYKWRGWRFFWLRPDLNTPLDLLHAIADRISAVGASPSKPSAVDGLREVPELIARLLLDWRQAHYSWFNDNGISHGY